MLLLHLARSCAPRHHHQAQLLSRALLSTAASVAAPETFRAKDLVVQEQRAAAQPPKLPEELAFGKVFTDHMLLIQHSAADGGWGVPRIVPFGPLPLHPAAQVLHYGTCCFEGMKAYAAPDGGLRLFRPELNMARLLRSAQRLVLAGFDPAELLSCIKALLLLDRAWLPQRPGHSMYIRPYMFSSDGALGVHRSSHTTLAVIMCPVGPYFKPSPGGGGAAAGVRLLMDTANVRAWPGGAGDYKLGGNYAPTVAPQMAAMAEHQCSQVMYALPKGPDPMAATIGECGAMNLFFVFQTSQPDSSCGSRLEVVTPPLDGTILPGVTRASTLELLRQQPGVQVSERELTVGELAAAHRDGRVLEVFGTGTAALVQPVGCVVLGHGQELALPAPPAAGGWGPEGAGSVADWARRVLTDIQTGRVPGHPWCVAVE